VRGIHKIVSFLLLLIFGFSTVKNLLPGLDLAAHNNCSEFAHVHFFHVHMHVAGDDNQKSISSSEEQDGECHGSAALSGAALVSYFTISCDVHPWSHSFQIVSTLENHFISPDLALLRRPPRFA
jgi:hypothetical protein